MNHDGKKMFAQAEAAVAAERASVAADRAEVKAMRKEVMRIRKENQEWGVRLMQDATRVDKQREKTKEEVAQERQALRLEQDFLRKSHREAEQAWQRAREEDNRRVAQAEEARRAAEEICRQAKEEKALTHDKNVRMAHTLDRLNRKLAHADAKMERKREEMQNLTKRLQALQQEEEQQRGLHSASLLSSPRRSAQEKAQRKRSQDPYLDDTTLQDGQEGDESSLFVLPPPRKKAASGISTEEEEGYDLLLSNLDGAGADGGGLQDRSLSPGVPHAQMSAALFARPKARAPASVPANSALSSRTVKKGIGDSTSFASAFPPRMQHKGKGKGVATPATKPGSSIHSFLQPRPADSQDNMKRLVRQAVQGNVTGSRHKIPSERGADGR